MKKQKKSKFFKITYIVYVTILAVLVSMALLYVNNVLETYENEHPQRHLENALALLESEAESGELWSKPNVPSMESGIFENGIDQKKEFLKKIKGDVKLSGQNWINENECTYRVISDGNEIAEIKLRKDGDIIQKLAIISIQKYELVSYVPLTHTYTLELPDDVIVNSDILVNVNGINLTEEHGVKAEDGKTTFTFDNLYAIPTVTITDKKENKANIKIQDGKITFDNSFYTLTLPNSLFVDVNGERQTGEALEDGRLNYRIRLVTKADVTISDVFGNTEAYVGKSAVPLTYYTFMTGDFCTVTVDGQNVPESCIEYSENEEYSTFADLVEGLPRLPVYKIVVLKDNADIKITDRDGNTVEYDKEVKIQDIRSISSGTVYDTVPEEVANEINVLKVLEDWSLYMTCDLNFNDISKYFIKNSYQYNVAWKYSYSIDRTFTSAHRLGNPPFEQESVSNFKWLTDNCFEVDIRFVKHMIVLGRRTDDEMNEKCYFVKYDDTKDNKDNPTWKLVAMKEIVNNAN
ncbi:MAG: hypothetical protein IKU48_06040 [Clostridia bacterium]|nr:hypothetical protein [Clostridia bacterium]